MSEWTPHVLTAAGRRLQAKVEAGTTLVLTKMKLGSGQETIDETDGLIDLVAVETELAIHSAQADGEICLIRGILRASTLDHGFYCREWGIFADDPDEGEILYAVLIDEKPDWIPSNVPTEFTITYDLNIAVSNGTAIQAEIDPTGLVDVYTLNSATHSLLRREKYKAGDIVTAATLPHGLVLEAQNSGITADTLADLSTFVCGDTFIDGEVSWVVKRLVVTTDDDGRIAPTGESCVLVREITIPADGWKVMDNPQDDYKMQIDVEIDGADETMFPQLALNMASLPIAGAAVLSPAIKAMDGFVRLWARYSPLEDMTGVIVLMSAPLNGGAGAHIFKIPVLKWKNSDIEDYNLQADISVPRATAKATPMVALDITSLAAAREAEICSTIQAFEGFVRVWARKRPEEDLKGTITLFFENGVNPARLPTANASILGGVKVQEGSGLRIDEEGNLSIDAATPEEILDVYDEKGKTE